MKKTFLALALLLVALPAFAGPVEEVTAAETAFAKAFADRDAEKFFSFVADDATFFGKTTLSGKPAVREQWSKFFESKDAPFSWKPDRVAASADGTLGQTHGPVFDPAGKHIADFASVWRKQKDGNWKILFDGGSNVCPEPPPPPPAPSAAAPAPAGTAK